MVRFWIILAVIVVDLTVNQCTENWPSSSDAREPRIQRVLEGRDVVLRCAGRMESTIAHWEYKPCGGMHSNVSCSDAIDEVRRHGVGHGWVHLEPTATTLKLRSVMLNQAGLYRCRHRASQLIDLKSSTQLEVLPHQNDEDTDIPQFIDGLPHNLTVYKDMQAVFQCKVSSRTPPRILWLVMKAGAGTGGLQYLEKWYDPLQPAGEVTLEGNVHLGKMSLPRARAEDAGTYFCLAVNTKGFSNRSAYLKVLGDDENADLLNGESQTWPLYLLFLLPFALAFAPAMLWLWYMCRVRRRKNKKEYESPDQVGHVLMCEGCRGHVRDNQETAPDASTVIGDLDKSNYKNRLYIEINPINWT